MSWSRRVKAERSIRRRLLGWLLLPLAMVLVASGIFTYRASLKVAADAYDRSLLDPALAIAGRLRLNGAAVELDLPPSVLEALQVDSGDRLFFSVSANGRLIAGEEALPLPPWPASADAPVFYDADHRGERVRVAALLVPAAGGLVMVQAAETLAKRERIAREVLITHAAVEILVFVVALAAVWLGVGRGLAPLEKLRAEIAKRSHRDLRPVDESQAPDEVRPMVRELNDLLGRLDRTIELQQQFVADAAHQLRTPLAALQAQVDAARCEPLTPQLAATVNHLDTVARRASRLTHQLLTLARVDPSAERPYAPQASDLGELMQPDLSDWLLRADGKRIDLGFELAQAPVAAEPELIRELAANLLDNALKYTPNGGMVTLSTGQRDGRSYLQVQDDGPGVPESEREKVFERFHRVKGAPGSGAGLGLAIVREIAHRHGARIELGEGPGGGTRVTVQFPPS
jgi:two-component system sensor histidine kinase TctE